MKVTEHPRIIAMSLVEYHRGHGIWLRDYAQAGIAEYWIIDSQRRVVIVNQLQDSKYQAIG
jgi:Uma2 family endonuclease